MSERQTSWIDSLGGPLMMLPASSLSKWRGSSGASEMGTGMPALGTDDGGTDYDWACAVNDLIAVRRIYGDVALVLNDQPLGTTWRQISSREGVVARAWTADQPRPVLSRMLAGLTDPDRLRLFEPDDVIDQIARDRGGSDSPEGGDAMDVDLARALKGWARGESARLSVPFRGEYTIFDSVAEGTDIRESLTLRLDPGLYEILSGMHRFDSETPSSCTGSSG
jgi:Immunity protein 21